MYTVPGNSPPLPTRTKPSDINKAGHTAYANLGTDLSNNSVQWFTCSGFRNLTIRMGRICLPTKTLAFHKAVGVHTA